MTATQQAFEIIRGKTRIDVEVIWPFSGTFCLGRDAGVCRMIGTSILVEGIFFPGGNAQNKAYFIFLN